MELVATIAEVLPLVSGVSARGEWKKATVVVKFMDGQYEQALALENIRNADEFAKLQVGASMRFHFNVTSREHNGRWFTSAVCWKWEAAAAAPQPMAPACAQSQPAGFNIPGQASGLPF